MLSYDCSTGSGASGDFATCYSFGHSARAVYHEACLVTGTSATVTGGSWGDSTTCASMGVSAYDAKLTCSGGSSASNDAPHFYACATGSNAKGPYRITPGDTCNSGTTPISIGHH